jgi:hypothetical protein
MAEDVAWNGFQDEPLVLPVICHPGVSSEEVVQDFWCKIGFPTPESRSWQRSAASSGKAEVSSNALSVLCRARSLSPVATGKGCEDRRASSSSPVGLHMAKPPRMGAWRGPLPRRRITPAPVLGDFMACAKTSPSRASAVPSVSEQQCKASPSLDDRAHRQGSAAIVAAVSCSSDRSDGRRDGERCWAASSGGPRNRWAGLGLAIQAAKRCRVLTLPRFDSAVIANSAAANAPVIVGPSPSSPPTSSSSVSTCSPLAGQRSFAVVVADHRHVLPMAGAPPRPSLSSSAPAGAAPQAPRPIAPPAAAVQPVYTGPPGF